MPNINEEPIEVILTRQVRLIAAAIDCVDYVDEVSGPLVELDMETRRALWRALGWKPCDELGVSSPTGLTECSCNEVEPPRPLTKDEPCTGDWRGCLTCNQNFLSYADGIGEYDVCRACHWDGKCLDPEAKACFEDGCEVYPDRHPGYIIAVVERHTLNAAVGPGGRPTPAWVATMQSQLDDEPVVMYEYAKTQEEAEQIEARMNLNLDRTRFHTIITPRKKEA